MDQKEFLARTLPAKGNYYGAYLDKSGNFNQSKPLGSIAELIGYLAQHSREDLYFATGTFSGSRKAEQANEKKCLYLDFDVGPNKDYNTKADALNDVIKLGKLYHKPSIIVDSGGGVHAYWTFDAPVSKAQWQIAADNLKRLCVENDIKADPAVTADAARVLRPPESLNFKYGQPTPVKVLFDGADYKFAALRPSLGVVPTINIAVNDEELISEGRTYGPAKARGIFETCPMMKDAIVTGGAGLSESLWNLQLYLLTFCEDGERYAHAVSKGYTGYSVPATARKFAEKKSAAANLGPTTCETFSAESSHCVDCKFKTGTPLIYGYPKPVEQDLPPFPYGRNEVKDCMTLQATNENGERQLLRLLPFAMTEFKLHTDNTVTFVARGRTIAVDTTKYQNAQTFNAYLAAQSFHVQDLETKNLRELIVAWSNAMQTAKKVTPAIKKLGWYPEGFKTASKFHTADGSVVQTASYDAALEQSYTPAGNLDAWQAASIAVTTQKRHSIDGILVSAFASPLVYFFSDLPALSVFMSPESGTGKTYALKLAQAVWGRPITSSMHDTDNAVLHKIGWLRNLPLYWDEIQTQQNEHNRLAFIFQLTQGSEKARLTQDIKAREIGEWKNMVVATSNESVADYAEQLGGRREAARARVFECEVPTITDETRLEQLPGLMVKIEQGNYGHAGELYVSFLVKNRAFVEKTLEALRLQVINLTGVTSSGDTRFWITNATTLIAGATFANHLKLTNIDLKGFHSWVIEQVMRQVEEAQEVSSTDPTPSGKRYVNEFLSHFRSQVQVVEHLPRSGVSPRVLTPVDRGEVVALKDASSDWVRINQPVFGKWLIERHYPQLRSVKLLLTKEGPMRTGRGKIDGIANIRYFEVEA